MPMLEGISTTRTTFGWRGTLITKYDIVSLKVPPGYSIYQPYVQLLSKKIMQIAWGIAADLVKRGLYLHAVTDCRLLEVDAYYAVDLFLAMIVQPYKENLSIDEIGYWETKFAERLMFDIRSYVGRQIPVVAPSYEASRALYADVNKPGVVTPEEYKARLNEVDSEVIKILKMANLMVDKPKPVEHKWQVINRGKIDG